MPARGWCYVRRNATIPGRIPPRCLRRAGQRHDLFVAPLQQGEEYFGVAFLQMPSQPMLNMIFINAVSLALRHYSLYLHMQQQSEVLANQTVELTAQADELLLTNRHLQAEINRRIEAEARLAHQQFYDDSPERVTGHRYLVTHFAAPLTVADWPPSPASRARISCGNITGISPSPHRRI